MDPNKMRLISNATNIEANGWKSKDHRNVMVKRIADYFIKRGPPSWTQNIPKLLKFVEKFEEEVFNIAKDEAEYNATISAKINPGREPLQKNESDLLPPKASDPETEKEESTDWRDQIYEKIQTMKNIHFKKLDMLYKGLSRRYEQIKHESVPQQSRTHDMLKFEHHRQALEYIFNLFKSNKSQITPDFEQNVVKVETYILSIVEQNDASSPSKNSQVEETSTKKPASQVIGLHNSYKVANQSSISHPQEVLVRQQGYGNAIQQQTIDQITPPAISTFQTLASPLLENRNEDSKKCQNQTTIVNDASPSPAMQHLIKVLNTVSAEALVASCEDIDMIFHLKDDKTMLEPLNGPPLGAIGTKLEDVNMTNSQARYLARGKFVPRRKMRRFTRSDSLASLEKPFSNSNTTQEIDALSKEIKGINMRLIDTEVVVVDKEKIFTTTAEAEGLTIKLLFRSVSVSANPMSDHGSCGEKPIINPLWLRIPTSYPHCSVIIIDDEMPVEASKVDLNDLSMKTKLKLRLSIQMLSQPLSLEDIAMTWDHCARETICEYAQFHGGGTFTTKYGGWEKCVDDN